jgi:hypothetical protein
MKDSGAREVVRMRFFCTPSRLLSGYQGFGCQEQQVGRARDDQVHHGWTPKWIGSLSCDAHQESTMRAKWVPDRFAIVVA